MKVEHGLVVRFHYAIQDECGEVLESTRDGEPLAVLHGRGNVMCGVEEALLGHRAGERFQVTLPPERAFGVRREDWTQRISKKHFHDARHLKPGTQTQLRSEDGVRSVTVIKVGGKFIDVDLNHPRAGRTLTFDLEVVDVREAAAEETAHRHVHGPGGHRH